MHRLLIRWRSVKISKQDALNDEGIYEVYKPYETLPEWKLAVTENSTNNLMHLNHVNLLIPSSFNPIKLYELSYKKYCIRKVINGLLCNKQ